MMTFQFVHNLFTTYTPAQADGKQINSQFSQANVHDKVLENGSTPSPPLWVCMCVCVWGREGLKICPPSQVACIKLGTTRTHPICAHRGRNRCFRTVISNGVTKRSLNRLWFLNFASKLKVTQCVFVRIHRTQRRVHKCWNIYWAGFMQRVPDRHPPSQNQFVVELLFLCRFISSPQSNLHHSAPAKT